MLECFPGSVYECITDSYVSQMEMERRAKGLKGKRKVPAFEVKMPLSCVASARCL